MDKSLYLKKLSAVFMLTLFLGLSLFGFEGALLCLGEDGHVAIEFVDACNGSDSGSQVAEAECDVCGPCNDIQFQSIPAYTNRTFNYTAAQPLNLVSLAWITPSLPLEVRHNSPISLPEKSLDKTLANLKSIVLLI
ncbi:MAG: hypothetical protein M0Z67_02355 [Nitrospiraceae bacterium]|nr:hypothetical protein [Nitrospiraceae bacterium]